MFFCSIFLFLGGNMDFILRCLPQELVNLIIKHNSKRIEEIRIRCGKQVILNMGNIEVVGICGNVVCNDNKVSNISHIYSLNIRIANEIDDASKEVISYILDTKKNSVFNTLIVSPPGCGKTTIIRDIAKK